MKVFHTCEGLVSPSQKFLILGFFLWAIKSAAGKLNGTFSRAERGLIDVHTRYTETRSKLECTASCLQNGPDCVSLAYNMSSRECALSSKLAARTRNMNISDEVILSLGYPNVYSYNIHSQTCIRKIDDLVSREDAATYCVEKGEQLATIRTVESLLWVAGLGDANRRWIGLKKDTSTGLWVWNENTTDALMEDLWMVNNPNGDGSCAEMKDVDGEYGLNDAGCNSEKMFFCENLHCEA